VSSFCTPSSAACGRMLMVGSAACPRCAAGLAEPTMSIAEVSICRKLTRPPVCRTPGPARANSDVGFQPLGRSPLECPVHSFTSSSAESQPYGREVRDGDDLRDMRVPRGLCGTPRCPDLPTMKRRSGRSMQVGEGLAKLLSAPSPGCYPPPGPLRRASPLKSRSASRP